mmetsp:Transcript_6565/g.12337  ORF Transcript_6565/g.12337 Transcript_6565/m.12337 type:complete len:234 (+) Transcript_6565:2439-3140(+)
MSTTFSSSSAGAAAGATKEGAGAEPEKRPPPLLMELPKKPPPVLAAPPKSPAPVPPKRPPPVDAAPLKRPPELGADAKEGVEPNKPPDELSKPEPNNPTGAGANSETPAKGVSADFSSSASGLSVSGFVVGAALENAKEKGAGAASGAAAACEGFAASLSLATAFGAAPGSPAPVLSSSANALFISLALSNSFLNWAATSGLPNFSARRSTTGSSSEQSCTVHTQHLSLPALG